MKEHEIDILKKSLTNISEEQLKNYFEYLKINKLFLKHSKIVLQYENSLKLAKEYSEKLDQLRNDYSLVVENINKNSDEVVLKYKEKLTKLKTELSERKTELDNAIKEVREEKNEKHQDD